MTNALFLCTGNSARSILAEVIVNQVLHHPHLTAYSAGSTPNGAVNPGAIAELERRGLSLAGLASQSWDDFTGPEAVEIDWVITLCDNAASETCPVFPGTCAKEHWGLPDPATGAATFADTFHALDKRIAKFIARELV